MKAYNQLKILSIGMILALISPASGMFILDEDKTNKINAMIITFIPMSIGALMIFYVLFVKSDEEKLETKEVQ